MNQCLLLLSKLQSILSDEIKWLYFNKLFLLPRQNFWYGDKFEVKGRSCSPHCLLTELFLNPPYTEIPDLSVSISISVLAWVSLPAPSQAHFVCKAIPEAEVSHVMSDTMELSLLVSVSLLL